MGMVFGSILRALMGVPGPVADAEVVVGDVGGVVVGANVAEARADVNVFGKGRG